MLLFLTPNMAGVTSRANQQFRELPGIQYIFPLDHVSKPGKFQRGIINPHLFKSICFQCGPTQPQKCS